MLKQHEREPVAAQQQEREQRSFDIRASVRYFRDSMDEDGNIPPEAREQVVNEEMSFLAEGIDRHSYTAFKLAYDEEKGLVYFAQGKWQSYMSSLFKARDVALKEAETDHRKNFLYHRTETDLLKGSLMNKLKPGEKMSWVSEYPEEEAKLWGDAFIASCGFKPDRKMAFIYLATKQEDGSITLESHTVDNSDRHAFDVVERAIHHDRYDTIFDLVSVYDSGLSEKRGGNYMAGRENYEISKNVNAYEFVKRNEGLFNHYIDRLEEIARGPLADDDPELVLAIRRLTYGVWARFKELLVEQESSAFMGQVVHDLYMSPNAVDMDVQIIRAFHAANARGDMLVGCGGAIGPEGEFRLELLAPEEAFDVLFGKSTKDPSDKFGSLTFHCPQGHKNKRPRNKLIDCCTTCGVSVKC